MLVATGRSDLAQQVPMLVVRDRCRCGDDFCAMFYTAPPPPSGQAWGPDHKNVMLEPTTGDVILDVVQDRIVAVEVLYRPDVRQALLALLR
jgi:hypothetical protein